MFLVNSDEQPAAAEAAATARAAGTDAAKTENATPQTSVTSVSVLAYQRWDSLFVLLTCCYCCSKP